MLKDSLVVVVFVIGSAGMLICLIIIILPTFNGRKLKS